MLRRAIHFGVLTLYLLVSALGYADEPNAPGPTYNNISDSSPTEENKRVVDIYYHALPLGKVEGYDLKNGFKVPLGALTNLLGFPIEIDPKQRSANGWFLSENEIFSLNTTKNVFVSNGKTKSFSPDLVYTSDTEIYVDISLLETMLPVELTFDESQNRVLVSPRQSLPDIDKEHLFTRWSLIRPTNTISSPRYGNNEVKSIPKAVPLPTTAPPEVLHLAEKPKSSDTAKEPAEPVTVNNGVPTTADLNEDNLTVLQPSLEDFTYDNFIESYHIGKHDFLPLGVLTQLLQVAITIDPSSGKASGWFLNEKNTFELDSANHKVTIAGKEYPIPEGMVLRNDTDIFVDSQLLGTWFPITFKVNSRLLTLKMQTSELFPQQLKAQRDKNWANTKGSGHGTASYPEIPVPYQAYSIPFTDVAIGHNYASQLSGERNTAEFSLRSSGDLGYLNMQSFISGGSQGLETARISGNRKDGDSELLGPLNATAFSVGDINAATVPLVAQGGQGLGAVVTNRPITAPTQFDTTDFIGTDLPGWDVELYRNGALLEMHRIGANGRYRFTNIPVLYGDNTFRLVFYGPQGQVREEIRHIAAADSVLKKGDINYTISADDKNETLLHVDNGYALPDKGLRAISEVDYGLTNNLTTSAGLMQIPINNTIGTAAPNTLFTTVQNLINNNTSNTPLPGSTENIVNPNDTELHRYATFGLSSNLPGGILARSYIANDTDTEKSALDLSALTSFMSLNIKADYKLFDKGFSSEDFESQDLLLTSSKEFEIDRQLPYFPNITAGLELLQNDFLSGTDQTTILSKFSGSFYGASITNNIGLNQYKSSATVIRDVIGDAAISTTLKAIALRAAIGYSMPDDQITTYSFTAQKQLRDNLTAQVGFENDLTVDNRKTLFTSINLDVHVAKISIAASIDNQHQAIIGTNVSFAVGRDPRNSKWHAQSNDMADIGAVSARAYLDKNYNGVYDGDDQWIDDIGLKIGNKTVKSDSDGTVFATGIPANILSTVTLDESSLKDPLLKVDTPTYSLISHPGAVTQINFPVVATSEIDGTVYLQKNGAEEPLPGAEVQLVNKNGDVVIRTMSEFDGFFLFEGIHPGEYTVRIAPALLKMRSLIAEERHFTVTGESNIWSEEQIILRPKFTLPLVESASLTPPATETEKTETETSEAVPVVAVASTPLPSKTAEPVPEAPMVSYIQLGAFLTEAAAEKVAVLIHQKYEDIINPYTATVEKSIATGKTLYKTIIRNVPDDEKNDMCDEFKEKHQPCIIASAHLASPSPTDDDHDDDSDDDKKAPPPVAAPSIPEKLSGSYIQLGAFSTKESAEKLKEAVTSTYASILDDNPVTVEENSSLFKVVIHPTTDNTAAICAELRKNQQDCIVRKG